MLKLLKYEFRKNRTGLLVMLVIAAVLFLMAPVGKWLENEDMMVISPALLAFYAVAAYIFVLVRGISAYSGELKNRSGYLLLMTPHSPIAILFSKLVFTLFFALLMLAVCIAALMGSGSILLGEIYEVKGFLNIADLALKDIGLSVAEIGYTFVFFLLEILGSVLSFVAIAYLTVTLGATLLQGKKGRGLITFIMFVVLYSIITELISLVTPMDLLKYTSAADVFVSAFPQMLIQLAFTLLCTGLSGVILKKWVCL